MVFAAELGLPTGVSPKVALLLAGSMAIGSPPGLLVGIALVTGANLFGASVLHAATRGAYREVDLYVPEMVDTTPALKAEAWFKAWQQAGAGRNDVIIERNPRSTIVIFRRGPAPVPGR